MSLPSGQALEQWLFELYQKLVYKARSNVHMSDLDEPRRSLNDRLDPKPPDMSTILNFVRGESSHSFFRDTLGQLPSSKVEQARVDKTATGVQLISHPDVMTLESPDWPVPMVWEFKTTLGARPQRHWVKRTHRYMAVEGIDVGVLAVHYLMQNSIKCYPMQLPAKRLENLKAGVLYAADLFDECMSTKENRFPQCEDCFYRGPTCRHRAKCLTDGIRVPVI